MNNVLIDFVQYLNGILQNKYLISNGLPIGLTKNKEYISLVKRWYVKEANAKAQELSAQFDELGFVDKQAIDGVISDVFFSFFQEKTF